MNWVKVLPHHPHFFTRCSFPLMRLLQKSGYSVCEALMRPRRADMQRNGFLCFKPRQKLKILYRMSDTYY